MDRRWGKKVWNAVLVVWLSQIAVGPLDAVAITEGSHSIVSGGELQTLEAIHVDALGSETVVTLAGLDSPDCQVERAADGRSIVLELFSVELKASESELQAPISSDGGLVDQVSAVSYQSEGALVTRVEVSSPDEVAYELVPSLEGLEIHLRAEPGEKEIAHATSHPVEADLDDPWAIAESLHLFPSDMPVVNTAPALLTHEDKQSESAAETTKEPLAQPVGGAETAEIFGLQFNHEAGIDRVAILADQRVDFTLFEADPETLVVRIPDARLAVQSGDRIKPEPGGPISLVSIFQQPEMDPEEVRVVIRRAPGAQARVTQKGSVLLVDLDNTGPAALPVPAFADEERAAKPIPQDTPAASALADHSDDQKVKGDRKGGPVGVLIPSPHRPVPLAPEAIPEIAVERSAVQGQGKGAPAAMEAPSALDAVVEGGLIEGKKYTGRRISLDFKEVQIADVLRLIAEVSDLNIIAGDEVKGAITIRLVDVPWDQALDVILLTKGLGFVQIGNVLRIASTEVLLAEEEVRLHERRNKEKIEDLEVELHEVNYSNVEDMKGLVARLLSPRGTVNIDVRTNTVIIKDIPSVIREAVALIEAVDTQTPQVMIEAKIVEASLDFGRELGSLWSIGTQPWTNGFNPGIPRTNLGSENFRFQGENNVVVGNPITSVATGTVNLGAFLLDDKMQVDVQIQAMEKSGEGKVISSPRVVTLDNREAIIEQGVSIPFQTFESGDAKLEFVDAVLSLKVTPQITADESIIMSLEVTRNAADASVSTPTGSPAIAKNQVKTETLVKNGQTLVIGGIYTIDKTIRESRVPYLHKIPFIGAMFKSREVSDSRKELLIFVTPRIVVNPALASR